MSVPSVAFLHGSGSRPDVWALQTARFQGAVALALADPAEAPPPATAQEAAERIRGAVAELEAPRALVGHSLGGAVAIELALAAPDLVDGLVLIATGARLPVPDSALDRIDGDFTEECRRLTSSSFVEPGSPLEERMARALDETGPEALRTAYEACRAYDRRGQLAPVLCPSLVISAAEDPLTPPWMGEELARELPNALLIEVADASHMLIAEHAPAVNLLIAGFLARLELTLAEA